MAVVLLPSYGVIKMYKCKHVSLNMAAAIIEILVLLLSFYYYSVLNFALCVVVGFTCAKGRGRRSCKKANYLG